MKLVSKQITIKAMTVSILITSIFSVTTHSKYSFVLLFNNTTFRWGVYAIIVTSFIFATAYFYDKKNNINMIVILLYILWNTICIIRGALVAEIYWDWKELIENTMILTLVIASYAATNIILTQSLLAFYFKYAIPLFPIFALFVNTDAWGFYLMGASLMLLFIPVLTKRQNLLLFAIILVIMLSDLGARSNVIKFAIPIVFLIIYYLKDIISKTMLELARVLLFVIPIVLFILGVSGIFNVFKMDEYIKKDMTTVGVDYDGERKEVSLTDDTRTFLYEEVLQSAKRNNYWLFGRTPARGNDSLTFGLWEFEWTGRYERAKNEIGLANVFTWTGLVGVLLYLFLFYHISYVAVNKSNNSFSKMLGLYVAFRWMFSWIEDYQNFTLNFLLLWIMIGMAASDSFRKMNDEEVAIWARGVFDSRYVKLQNLFIKQSLYEKSKDSSTVDMSQQKK